MRSQLADLVPTMVLVTAMLLKVSYFNFPPGQHLDNDWYGWRLSDAVRAALGSLGTLLLFVSPTLVLRSFPRFVVLWLLDLALTVMVLADVLHFRYFGDIVSFSVFSTWRQILFVGPSLRDLLEMSDILFLTELALAPLLFRGLHGSSRTLSSVGSRARFLPLATFSMGVALVSIPAVAITSDPEGVFEGGWFRYNGVRKVGLLNYHLYDAGGQLLRDLTGKHQVDEGQRQRVREFLARHQAAAEAPSELFGIARGSNLIVIMVESLHAFPLGLRIEGRNVTPHLNAWARRSMHFENFYSQAWEGTTSDGEFTSLQSLHPLRAGSIPTTYPTHYYRGLPRILREHGYSTLSAHAYYGDLWRMREMHPRLGFERSLFRENYEPTELMGMGLSDSAFFQQTLPHLKRLPRPYMAFLMTLSTHHPYDLPVRNDALPLPFGFEYTVLGKYLRAVHYFDGALGAFLDRLEAEDVLDKSVLVIYGDHAGYLGDPYFLSSILWPQTDPAAQSKAFDPRIWAAENRLPLIIHLPQDRAAGVRFVSGGHLDIAPTLLTLLGISNHEMISLGQDLTRAANSLVVFRDGSFVEGTTLCRPADAFSKPARCWNVESRASSDPGPFARRIEQARQHLEISDLIVKGDLIPRK